MRNQEALYQPRHLPRALAETANMGPPCPDCARAIVQSGIRQVVCHLEFPGPPNWSEALEVSRGLLARTGVGLRFWSGVPIVREIRASGAHAFAPRPAPPQGC